MGDLDAWLSILLRAGQPSAPRASAPSAENWRILSGCKAQARFTALPRKVPLLGHRSEFHRWPICTECSAKRASDIAVDKRLAWPCAYRLPRVAQNDRASARCFIRFVSGLLRQAMPSSTRRFMENHGHCMTRNLTGVPANRWSSGLEQRSIGMAANGRGSLLDTVVVQRREGRARPAIPSLIRRLNFVGDCRRNAPVIGATNSREGPPQQFHAIDRFAGAGRLAHRWPVGARCIHSPLVESPRTSSWMSGTLVRTGAALLH